MCDRAHHGWDGGCIARCVQLACELVSRGRQPFFSLVTIYRSSVCSRLSHTASNVRGRRVNRTPFARDQLGQEKSWDKPKVMQKITELGSPGTAHCRGVAVGNNTQGKTGQKLADALTSTNMASSGLTLSSARRGVGSKNEQWPPTRGEGTRTVRESMRYRGRRGKKDKK